MFHSHRATLLTSALFIGVFLTACDGRNSFSSYSNYDLKEAWSECKSGNLSAGGAQRCKNIEKECKYRLNEKGFRC